MEWNKKWKELTGVYQLPSISFATVSFRKPQKEITTVCVCVCPDRSQMRLCVCVSEAGEGRFSGHPSSCGRAVWHCISGARARPRCSVCVCVRTCLCVRMRERENALQHGPLRFSHSITRTLSLSYMRGKVSVRAHVCVCVCDS